MGLFSLKHTWNYPSNNYGQIFGIADSGVETFKGTPIKSLAREICQNSIDANLHNGKATQVEFVTFEISPTDIPDFAGLQFAFTKALDFWSQQKSNKATEFFRKALKCAEKESITCLRISDHNTTGLVGSREEYNSPWCNLTKSTGASDKSGTNGGSFGIGKFAPYACSAFRTVFYSTADNEGICAYQGVSRLTSFKNKKGEITQGTGFFGNDKNSPVYSQISLDPNYIRKQDDYGTDIYILAFTGDGDWKHQMVASILDGFLYAINNNQLVVNVDGIKINKNSLPDLMISHKRFFQENADEYYSTLVDDKVAKVFEEKITDNGINGKLTLRLMIMPEFHRRVAMVRQTGMKIKDKGNINGLIPFAGVMYIEGDELNSYLRSLENPQHLEWEIERADNKSKARKLLSRLTKFIKKSLDSLKDDDSEEALDPAVGEYLSAEQDDKKDKDKAENLNDTIKEFEVKVNKIIPKPVGSQSEGSENELIDNPNGEIDDTDVPGTGSGTGTGTSSGGSGGGSNPGSGSGSEPTEHKKSLIAVGPAKIRVLCINKNKGKYRIVFTPKVNAVQGYMDILMAAESQNYNASISSASCVECPTISVRNNRLENLKFVENQSLIIDVIIDYSDLCSMEVKAYGNKV